MAVIEYPDAYRGDEINDSTGWVGPGVNPVQKTNLALYMKQRTFLIQTPDGIDRYDLYYKTGAIFQPAKAVIPNQHTALISMMINEERGMSFKFDYVPSDETFGKLYDLIRSACDTIGVQITNVVEHAEDYSIIFYMRTSGTFSYIKIYVNSKGFITNAKPMSLLGTEDSELNLIIETINSHFV